MAGASHARLRLIADSQFGGAATSWAPATWYVGLSITEPNDEGGGFTEPVGGSYTRVAVTNSASNWPAAVTEGGRTVQSNGTVITFVDPTGSWGTIGFYGLFTAASGGVAQFSNPLDTPLTVRAGNTPVQFDVGQLILRLRGRV